MDKIVFCGGGTLGHFTPNIAIYENLKGKYNFYYICSKNGVEKNIISGIMPYSEIQTAKLKRSLSFSNLILPFKLIKGVFDAKKLLKAQKPALIFSKGGFASVPVVIAGKMLKIPCITHESDQTLGLANKVISKMCKYVCTSFEETAKQLSNGVYTGTPIRKQIFNGNSENITEKYKINAKKHTILVIGGSLGSEKINKTIRNCLKNLTEYNILHITGKGKLDSTIFQDNYIQVEFANDIENYYTIADLVITRGGSNTLFELLALKKTMIIIPLGTSASRGDQIQNAKVFKSKGYANVIFEEDLSAQTLINEINSSLKNIKTFTHYMELNFKDGTKEVCKIIENTIKNAKKS